MIRFDQVTKQYARTARPALNAVNLEILRGEFVFLVGASGSGKSSFLRLILREERPNRGQIHVLGQDLASLPSRKVPYFRRNLGVVFQDFRLLPGKTVYENVAFTLEVIGKSRGFVQEAVPDVLQMVGLGNKTDRLPHELSGGEQQRVAIARAIVNKPQLLLADEPTGNLDPATSQGIMSLLERINANGTTVVMATHAADLVDQMQRRVVELVAGDIVRDERGGGYQTQAVPIQQQPGAEAPSRRRDLRETGAITIPSTPATGAVPLPTAPESLRTGQQPAQPAAAPVQPATAQEPGSAPQPETAEERDARGFDKPIRSSRFDREDRA